MLLAKPQVPFMSVTRTEISPLVSWTNCKAYCPDRRQTCKTKSQNHKRACTPAMTMKKRKVAPSTVAPTKSSGCDSSGTGISSQHGTRGPLRCHLVLTKHLSNMEWENRDKSLSPSLPRRIGCLQVLKFPQKTKMMVVNPESHIILN